MKNNILEVLKVDNALAQAGAVSSDMFIIKTANQTIAEAKNRPDPRTLWKTLWYEGETCCLFADSNVGKSIYAVQIANDIAQHERVLYFDFELSEKQFQLRYTDNNGIAFLFSDTLFRVEFDATKIDVTNFEDVVVSRIEATAIEHNCSVIIIDNLSYLCNASDKAETAGVFMQRLMNLKRKHGWSMLVLAHTPKRKLSNPITQNDLAGSKKLFNFFDSVFAIGKSAKDSNLRYIKQLKTRSGEFMFNENNIIICTIEKKNSFLQFVEQGYDCEWRHLKEHTKEDDEQDVENIMSLHNNGKSIREIAKELDISKSKVGRIVKAKTVPDVTQDTTPHLGTATNDNEDEPF